MRAMRSVGFLFGGLLLVGVLNAQPLQPLMVLATMAQLDSPPDATASYLKTEAGTWMAGAVDDLVEEGRALTLLPKICHEHSSEMKVGIGFVVTTDFAFLDVMGAIKAPSECEAEVLLKNFLTGACELPHDLGLGLGLGLGDSDFILKEIPADSAAYQDPASQEVEVCLVFRCRCTPPYPTDKDAVSVQELSLGPTPK